MNERDRTISGEYKIPSWRINDGQSSQLQGIIKNYAIEFGLREGLEYRPNNMSIESPILIQEYFRLFLTQNEILWEGILDPDGEYFKDERTLVDRIRKIVPEFASKKTLNQN